MSHGHVQLDADVDDNAVELSARSDAQPSSPRAASAAIELLDEPDSDLEPAPRAPAPASGNLSAPVPKVTVEASVTLLRRTAAQFAILALCAAIYMLLFAGPGLGFASPVRGDVHADCEQNRLFSNGLFFWGQLINFVIDYEWLMSYLILVGGSIMFVLYVTDFSHWTGHFKKLKKFLLCLVGLATVLAALVASDRLPGAAIAVYFLIVPGVVWLVKYLFYKTLHPVLYGYSMGIALMAISICLAAAWVIWVFQNEYYWTNDVKLKFNGFVACNRELAMRTAAATTATTTTMTTTTTATTVSTTMESAAATATTSTAPGTEEVPICLEAWVMWAAPLLGAANSFVFGLTGLLLARAFKRQTGDAPPIDKALKLFLLCLSMSVVLLWVAGAIAGAGIGINNAAQYLVAVTILVVCGAMISTIGWQRLTSYWSTVPLARQLTASLLTDWFKALFVLFLMPVVPAYFLLSFLNQMVRRAVSFGYDMSDAKERKLWLTLAVAIQFKMLKRWRWTSVLQKAMWIGLFYVIVQVGIGLLVTVFLSWINVALQDLPLYAVTIIFFFIGMAMFLLPPVPGLPVFITGGILLGKAAEQQFTFFGAVAYGIGVCWLCKQTSLLLQQKMIGQGMSGSLYIRKTVGVNSITIRAIRRLLRKPGLSVPKVMILIGGPDWPTSVLTGILRLSWLQMQIGTAPIVFLIIPMVASGAFLLKTSEGGLWGPLTDVTIAVAALSQIIAILLAMYYISGTAEKCYDELRAEPDDEEVAAAERADAEKTALTLARQSFYAEDFPWWMGALLMLGTLSISVCCYILIIIPSQAFLPFSLTDTVEAKLNNDLLNLVLPYGWAVIGLTTFTTVVLIVLGRWTKYRITHLPPNFQIPRSIALQLGLISAEPSAGSEANAAAAADAAAAAADAALPGSTRSLEAQRDAQHQVKGIAGAITSVTSTMFRPDEVAEAEALAAKRRRQEKQRQRALTSGGTATPSTNETVPLENDGGELEAK
jgi:hypothetical protein